ncbi:uncharacterized protein LOC118745624 isoform X2 [Rhagoletis pomonella]|uniref:uncharacterized protein LOC118745624 isoform X2 n=1 Tax=Rhagoletis pomonella TaxID=28610 RepID=UPI0017856831|nr:uncharacterized protein LOC118745624 isoform X2 [Rhagoletis pomonella]
MSSLLQQQLTLEKRLKTTSHTAGAVLPPSPAPSPSSLHVSISVTPAATTNTLTGTLSNVSSPASPAPLDQEQLYADTAPMTAVKTLNIGGADYVSPTSDGRKNASNGSGGNCDTVDNQSVHSTDQALISFQNGAVVRALHTALNDMNTNHNVATTLSLPLSPVGTSIAEVVSPVAPGLYGCGSAAGTNKSEFVDNSLTFASDATEVRDQPFVQYGRILEKYPHKREFAAELMPTKQHIKQQQRKAAHTEMKTRNESESAASPLESPNLDVKSVGETEAADDDKIPSNTNTYLHSELLNDALPKGMLNHLPSLSDPCSDPRLTQTRTPYGCSIPQTNSNQADDSVSQHLPSNDFMEPATAAIMDKDRQLLARLFSTDLVIPKCYQRRNADAPRVLSDVNLSFSTTPADDTVSNETNSRLERNNGGSDGGIRLENPVTSSEISASLSSYLRPIEPTTELSKQPSVSSAAFTLLTEILLRHHDHQQLQVLSAAANASGVAPNLQMDTAFNKNKTSVAEQPQTHLHVQPLPIPLQLPIPLSLSLPLPLPLLPIINTSSNAHAQNPSYNLPPFLYGGISGSECKEPIYLKQPLQQTLHEPQASDEQLQKQQRSSQLLATQILCSRLLRANAPALSEHLRERELHFIDYASSGPKMGFQPDSALPRTHYSNNNRHHVANNSEGNNNSNASHHTMNCDQPENRPNHHSASSDLLSEIGSDDPYNHTAATSNIATATTSTKLSFEELLSAQEVSLSQAQMHLDQFLAHSMNFVELTAPNSSTSVKRLSRVVPLVKVNMQQRKQLIDCIQVQINQLKRQCASAKLYYERGMCRLQSSEALTQQRQCPSSFVAHKIATSAAVAAMSAAVETHPLPPLAYIKTELMHKEDCEGANREAADVKEYNKQSSMKLGRSLVEIENEIEQYVQALCKNNGNDSAVEKDNHDTESKNNLELDEGLTCGANHKEDKELGYSSGKWREEMSGNSIPTGGDVSRCLTPASPICFWHPENRGHCVNDSSLTVAEIILECAALTVQASMRDSGFSVNSLSTSRNCAQPQNRNVELNSAVGGQSQHSFGTAPAAGNSNSDLTSQFDSCNVADATKGNAEKSLSSLVLGMTAPTPVISPMPVNTSTSTPTLVSSSTPTTTPTPPLTANGLAAAAKSRRKSNYAHRIETIGTQPAAPKHVAKTYRFYEQQNSHNLRQCYNSNGSGSSTSVRDGANDGKNYQDEKSGKQREGGLTNHSTEATAATSAASEATLGHQNSHQQQQYALQQQQDHHHHQTQFNVTNNSKNNNNCSNSAYGIHAAGSNTPNVSATAAATVVALQERAFTDIFKARFNALTAAAVMNATVGISAAAAAAAAANTTTAPDGPYDLSISGKVKKTNLDTKISAGNPQGNECKDNSNEKKKPHIKKPLNAFMLYMKEMRAKVVAECTLKESAAINQILGRRWHALGREEQAKYYELARRERQLHMQMYPDWSSRTNTSRGKKRKRKQDTSDAGGGGNNMKKCRARFGLDQQNQWCKPCRRKKKCIRYMEAISSGSAGSSSTKDDCYQELDDLDDPESDDNLGSPGSGDDNNKTPDDDTESLNHSLSSPGCLSGLSSLQSPSTSLASPLNLLASPAAPVTVGLTFGLGDHQYQQQNAQSHQQLPQHASSLQAQQQLVQPSSIVDTSAAQQARLSCPPQQLHLKQHPQQHYPLAHTEQALANSSVFEHSKATKSFFCGGGMEGVCGGVDDTLMSPALSNNGASGMGLGNNLTNTSSSTAAAAASAFTERTMRTLLNPSPSTSLLHSNCFPPSSLESKGGAIVSIAQMLSNTTSNATSSVNARTSRSTSVSVASSDTTTNYSTTVETGTSNGCNSYTSNLSTTENPSELGSNGNYESIQLAPATQSNANKSTPLIDGKSSSASSAASSPAADNLEKSNVTPAHRNPIGANPHDINNPLSINQLTKCSESISNSSSHNKSQSISVNENLNVAGTECSTTLSSSVSNGTTQTYKVSSHQKQLASRLPTSATPHQQLLPPAPLQYQQQFHLCGSSGPPPPPPPMQHHTTLHHAHHHHPKEHSPLFNQHFQQFSHHLASVAAVAAAAAGVHIPNIIGAAAVASINNSIHRSGGLSATNDSNLPSATNICGPPANALTATLSSITTTTAAATSTTSAAEEITTGCNSATTNSSVSLTPINRRTGTATAADSSVANVVVNTSTPGGEKGAISVT